MLFKRIQRHKDNIMSRVGLPVITFKKKSQQMNGIPYSDSALGNWEGMPIHRASGCNLSFSSHLEHL